MARQTFEDWIPEEWGGPVITKVMQTSVIEGDNVRREPMSTDTKHVLRDDGGMDVGGAIGKGVAYDEDTQTNDSVLLTVRKLGRVLRVADEDMKDTAGLVDILATKRLAYARSYAIGFDNACLGITAASNGTTRPFDSLYYKLTQANAAVGYSANSNITTPTTAGLTYDNVSDTFELVETSDFWEDGSMVVFAHPAFKAALRNILDDQGRPVFLEHQSQVSGSPATLMGVPVKWTLGAKTDGVITKKPFGKPLLFVGNGNYLLRGDRSPLEYKVASPDSGPAFLTDEGLLKVRRRVAFAVGNENAWACIHGVG